MADSKDWDWVEYEGDWENQRLKACIKDLRARVEALESHLESIGRALDLFNSKYSKSAAEEVTPIVAGLVATDADLYEIYRNTWPTQVAFRAIYNLGREHGALAAQTANCKPTANYRQISSFVPTGLVERVEKRIKKEKWVNHGIDEDECARAAIREVAAAARLKWEQDVWATSKEVAQWLEQEAGK